MLFIRYLELHNHTKSWHTSHMACVEFEVPMALTVRSTILWDVTPCILVEIHRRLGGKYCLHPQGRRVNQATSNKHTSAYF
jgi:hypothetical protein